MEYLESVDIFILTKTMQKNMFLYSDIQIKGDKWYKSLYRTGLVCMLHAQDQDHHKIAQPFPNAKQPIFIMPFYLSIRKNATYAISVSSIASPATSGPFQHYYQLDDFRQH